MQSYPSTTIKAVLFDLDGVLVDTEGIYTEIWSEIDRNFPTGIQDFAHVIKGNTLERIFSTYYTDPDTQQKILVQLAERERTMQYRLFPGVEDLLRRLKQQGILTAIVTSSSPRKMQNLFDQIPSLRQYIDTIITDADVTKSKPDPQGYLLAAERLDVAPEQCIVAEDSLSGLEAGRRSGANVVAVATTLPRQALQGQAPIILDTIASLSLQ